MGDWESETDHKNDFEEEDLDEDNAEEVTPVDSVDSDDDYDDGDNFRVENGNRDEMSKRRMGMRIVMEMMISILMMVMVVLMLMQMK